MMKKAWGIICKENEVEDIEKALEKRNMDVFEVRPLSYMEMITYLKDICCRDESYIVMFHATTLQYKWFLFRFRNGLSKVF